MNKGNRTKNLHSKTAKVGGMGGLNSSEKQTALRFALRDGKKTLTDFSPDRAPERAQSDVHRTSTDGRETHDRTHRSKLPAILSGKPIVKPPIPITKPTIPEVSVILKKYREVFKSGMITNAKYVQEFEERIQKQLGVKHAIVVNSCTSGLILILKALDLKGEAILPSFTFHATAHAVVWNNLTPIFVDCDRETFTIDPNVVEKAITPKTAVIVAVHTFGNPPDIKALESIAKKHNVPLIFDAAHGFGAQYQGNAVGGEGKAQSFSMSPTKLLTAGEGGVVTTNDTELARKVRISRNYGDSGDYDPEFSGLSARMSELSAILGIESLKILEKNAKRRNKLVGIYKQALQDVPGISFQTVKPGNRNSYKDFGIIIDKEKFGLSRDVFYEALLKENIIAKKYFYPPVHKQKAFQKYTKSSLALPITNFISNNTFSLPLFSHMPEDEILTIAQAIINIHNHAEEIAQKFNR